MAGISASGFEIKRLDQIRQGIEARLREAFGDVDLSPESPLGQWAGIEAEKLAQAWELAADLYASQYPMTATGVNQDRVVDFNGITRQAAVPTTVFAVSYGTQGTNLTTSTQARNTVTGDLYRPQEAFSIRRQEAVELLITVFSVAAAGYTVTVAGTPYTYTASGGDSAADILQGLAGALPFTTSVSDTDLRVFFEEPSATSVSSNLAISQIGTRALWRAVEPGAKLLPALQLVDIVTPVAGWQSISNPLPGLTGRERETDAELRERRTVSVRRQSRGPLDAIQGAIGDVEGVADAVVYHNVTDATDADGLPPGWVWVVVAGGDNDQIALALAESMAAGTGTFGSETGTFFSQLTGLDYEFNFDRPTTVPVYIALEIVTNSEFPPGGAGQIRAALVEYGASLRIGQALKLSRLYTPINSVAGHFVDELAIGTDPNPTEQDNIIAARNERLVILPENITIVSTPG